MRNETAAMIPERIVIDTNVCLDLFVFRDPRWTMLHDALRARTVEAVTREDCRMEWLVVLNYTHLPLDEVSRPRAIAEFDALIDCVRIADLEQRLDFPLPLCKDPDDQKFLEFARDADAQVLITKDKALLKLAKRIARAGLFSIQSPEAWVAAMQSRQETALIG